MKGLQTSFFDACVRLWASPPVLAVRARVTAARSGVARGRLRRLLANWCARLEIEIAQIRRERLHVRAWLPDVELFKRAARILEHAADARARACGGLSFAGTLKQRTSELNRRQTEQGRLQARLDAVSKQLSSATAPEAR